MRAITPLLLASLSGVASAAEIRYHAVRLTPMVPGGTTTPFSIVEDGRITGGASFHEGGGYNAAVYWAHAQAEPVFLGGAPGSESRAMDAGAGDLMVGFTGSAGGPFVFENGEMELLVGIGGVAFFYATPVAVNAFGDIVGAGESGGRVGYWPVIWQNRVARALPQLDGSVYGFAWDINDARQAVGFNSLAASGTTAVLWNVDSGGVTDLGTPDFPLEEALAINNAGEVVGYYEAATNPTWRPFHWAEGITTPLPFLTPGTFGNLVRARDINDHGVMVGEDGHRALLWPDTETVIDLNTRLLDAPRDFHLWAAHSINNAGQILASGDLGSNGYLLQPFTCAGDANLDSAVNAADLSVLLSKFGVSGAAWDIGDFNGDGSVNGADLSVLLGTFGTGCP